METRLITKDGKTYLECLPDAWQITSERDALDLVGACGENGTQRLLLHAASLPPEFYKLRTGLAGDVLQKFVTYHLKVAAVIPLELVNQGRFAEMVLESNRGNQFRVYQTQDEAEAWLIRE